MTALEMLKELQKEWEFQAKDQGIVTNYRLGHCSHDQDECAHQHAEHVTGQK